MEEELEIQILAQLLNAAKRDSDFAAYIEEYGYTAALTYMMTVQGVDSLGQMGQTELLSDIVDVSNEQIEMFDPNHYHN